MRKLILIIVAILVFVGVIVIGKGNNDNSSPAPAVSNNVKSLPQNVKIYDVRTAEEYATAHVKSAELFPVENMEKGKLPDVAKDTAIAVYCRSGRRATEAVELLTKAGYTNVTNIGGLDDLSKYGLRAE